MKGCQTKSATMRTCIALLLAPVASGLVAVSVSHRDSSCAAADTKNRVLIQNKLAAVCEDMCKEVGAYPKCSQCPAFVAPDSTPNVMTWPELNEHMDNLVAWGQESIKGWKKQASALVQKPVLSAIAQKTTEQSCAAADTHNRMQFQNKLAAVCEDMCKEVGAYPKCSQCPAFVAPDSTPNVMTWPELNEHMDNLVAWGQESIKGWKKQASALQKEQKPILAAISQQSCVSADAKNRMLVQNKLAAVCEDMCKEVGAYPKCSQCPAFVAPDSTPNVMTWPELNEHMDNLVAWGQESIKGWKKQASALVQKPVLSAIAQTTTEQSCVAADTHNRMQFQNKLAAVCEDMCKEVGAYPKCSQCPAFVAPDSTPNVMTWPELNEHMDNLVAWGQESIKGWKKQASALQTGQH